MFKYSIIASLVVTHSLNGIVKHILYECHHINYIWTKSIQLTTCWKHIIYGFIQSDINDMDWVARHRHNVPLQELCYDCRGAALLNGGDPVAAFKDYNGNISPRWAVADNIPEIEGRNMYEKGSSSSVLLDWCKKQNLGCFLIICNCCWLTLKKY